MDPEAVRKPWNLKFLVVVICVGEVGPEGEVRGRAVSAARAEDDVEDGKFAGDLHRPSEEHIGDDADWRSAAPDGGVEEEGAKMGAERVEGVEEADDVVAAESVGVLAIGREAVVRAAEGELYEAEKILPGNFEAESLNVEGSAYKGDDEAAGVSSEDQLG